MELILKDGYYVDSNNNKWSADKYTLEQAIERADTLVDCRHCIDCEACRRCIKCVKCKWCSYYENCVKCL
ncbi:hypothetical protein [Helicobacter trogontum]|uniref:hypothetical protein n=1 Tax=Helicobacter trogontum TaxID=50960 RepID=UPI000CF0D482|nr:hypothetical protein [Helicobacter trogontum]